MRTDKTFEETIADNNNFIVTVKTSIGREDDPDPVALERDIAISVPSGDNSEESQIYLEKAFDKLECYVKGICTGFCQSGYAKAEKNGYSIKVVYTGKIRLIRAEKMLDITNTIPYGSENGDYFVFRLNAGQMEIF